jgi:hypothetical protein
LDLWAALPAEGSSGDVPNKDIREDVCAEELSGSGVEVMAMTMLTIKRSSGAGGTNVYRDLHLRLRHVALNAMKLQRRKSRRRSTICSSAKNVGVEEESGDNGSMSPVPWPMGLHHQALRTKYILSPSIIVLTRGECSLT